MKKNLDPSFLPESRLMAEVLILSTFVIESASSCLALAVLIKLKIKSISAFLSSPVQSAGRPIGIDMTGAKYVIFVYNG